jgi:hypothetical protein
MNRFKHIATAQRLMILVAGCLAVAFSPTAMAQLGEVNFLFQDGQGPADATIIVPVEILSFVGASTAFFRVEVDEMSLALVDVLPGLSATSAGKGVSVGVDAQNRPTVLVTDFGGGTDVIPNGDLVFLIFRSAAGLSVGTDISVSGSDSSAATPAGDMLTTAVIGANVEIVACTDPARPSFIAASDGTLSDRVSLGWLPVNGASEYAILRNTSNDIGTAEVLANLEETQFDDTSATAAMLVMGGCQGQNVPEFEVYYYWVVAVNACGISPASPVDSGYRGLDAGAIRLQNSPLQASATPIIWLAAVAGFAWTRRRRLA